MLEQITLSALVDFLPSLSGAVAMIFAALGTLAVGAITQSNTRQGVTFFRTELSSSTADTTAAIAHGLGTIAADAGTVFGGLAPQDITFTPLGAGITGITAAWRVVSVNSTNVNIRKSTTSLSGGANQVALIVRLPHSLVR